MEVKQCEFCRVPFHSYGSRICKDCLIRMDEAFFRVRDYLYEHDRAGIEEVSHATGVTKKAIMYLLKEERLLVGDDKGDVGGFLRCEACKKPINTGRMCKGCKNQVLSEMQQVVTVPKKQKEIKSETEDESMDGVAKLSLKGR